jgi:hypothetical protein
MAIGGFHREAFALLSEAFSPTEAEAYTNSPTEAETPTEADTRPAASPAQAAAQPSRFDLDRFPPEVRPTLQEFEAGMKQDLLTISPVKPLCPCGSTRYVDTPIHGGQSLRRNCLQCGRFLGFPVWYEQRQEDLRPDPIPADGIRSLLDRAAALGWPELELSPWDVVGPSEARWRAFARYLARPQPTPSAETTRLRSFWLALLKLDSLEAQSSCPKKALIFDQNPASSEGRGPF